MENDTQQVAPAAEPAILGYPVRVLFTAALITLTFMSLFYLYDGWRYSMYDRLYAESVCFTTNASFKVWMPGYDPIYYDATTKKVMSQKDVDMAKVATYRAVNYNTACVCGALSELTMGRYTGISAANCSCQPNNKSNVPEGIRP